MNILIRLAKIIDTGSKHHNTVKDVFIQNGVIAKIGSNLKPTGKYTEVKLKGLQLSLGWVDMNSYFADPGFEHKETIESGCKAAAAGGFTHVCAMPNTMPIMHNKSMVEYMLSKAKGNIVNLLPVGAVTQKCEGKELAELYDMFHAGAVAFSDGGNPSLNAGLLERALDYIKAFDGILLVHPEDKSIAKHGVMHEGVFSTKLGLPAMPAFAETLAVARDLFILDYTQSRLHFLDVSLKKSLELIKNAKKKNGKLTVSVNAYNLLFTDEAVGSYNTQFKLNPPLRLSEDIAAMVKAIQEGTVDTITSQHQPHEEDCKKLEFDKADFGMIGLETSFAVANTALNNKVDTETLVKLFSTNARKILKLEENSINEGNRADLTLFSTDTKWTFTEKDIFSQSKNTPFIGKQFVGKPLGIVNNNQVFLSSELQ